MQNIQQHSKQSNKQLAKRLTCCIIHNTHCKTHANKCYCAVANTHGAHDETIQNCKIHTNRRHLVWAAWTGRRGALLAQTAHHSAIMHKNSAYKNSMRYHLLVTLHNYIVWSTHSYSKNGPAAATLSLLFLRLVLRCCNIYSPAYMQHATHIRCRTHSHLEYYSNSSTYKHGTVRERSAHPLNSTLL